MIGRHQSVAPRRKLVALAAASTAFVAAVLAGPAGSAGAVGSGAPSDHLAVGHTPVSQSASISQAPGDVRYQAPPGNQVSGPSPDPNVADLVSATAADDGTTVSFSAKTQTLNDPATDPNWLNNTYIGWAIDPVLTGTSSTPLYYAYFQLNPDGTYNGELTYAATDTPVSCTVTLAFDTTNGYQAQVPTACLAGITTFRWYAYSLYDTSPPSVDPTGANGYGRAIPDPNTYAGGAVYASTIAQPPAPVPTTTPGITPGYWLFARDGGVFAFGAAPFLGSLGAQHLNMPVVGGTATLDGAGYWMVASDGGIFAFGDARFYGSMGGQHLNAPIVAIVPLPTGTGYWLIASDGGVFAFGGARSFGSMGGVHLNAPIVGGASSADGLGYWLVASDGGIFAFGDAVFQGSEGGAQLNQPIVNMALAAHGYDLVAADGGIFAFGGAPFYGSTGAMHLNQPIEGLALTGDNLGYRMVASDGGIFSFGTAPFYGSEGGSPLNQPIVGMASRG
jgi:hypothetical protein